ncbi:hypothetical protein FQA39_LY00842 [Lamprigera yunnana]|nr:hypothetical protein FQA39_LY00842 [Lamprigera yunnana]
MSEIEKKIIEYGQKRKQKELQEYVRKIDANKLVSYVQSNYNTPNFKNVWDYLMQSFTDSRECHNKRFEIVTNLLHELEKGLCTSSNCNNLLTRLCIEFPKFKSEHLIEICSFCIECIQKGNVSEMCWKDILPEALNVVVECNHIIYNDNDMTGLEYKTQLVNSLCMLMWSPSIITSLATMFIEMPLTKEEHFQIVNKLGKDMEKLTCQELPPFVYQMLKLCQFQNSRSIFLRLQYYFGVRIYNRKNFIQNSDSVTTSVDSIVDAVTHDANEAESTIFFHIYQSASDGNECIKDYLSSLKNLIKSPEFIIHPFQFTVLLTISTVIAYQEKAMEILRNCISRSMQEDLKKNDSCLIRDTISSTLAIEDMLQQVIECSTTDRYFVVEGLVELAYILLRVAPSLSRDSYLICERQWHLGKMILIKVLKKRRQIASCIISELSNHIVSEQNVYHYIHCIHILCQKMSLVMLDNQSDIVQLMEYLPQLPGSVANHLFDAILPLTKISPTIRDRLILLLRKALYSRTLETRRMAVTGFLKLIKELKISNLAVLSQSSSNSSSWSSGHSLFTQVTLTCSGRATTNIFSNEALCLEVLSILRQCFMQQAAVRNQLYDGLYDAVCVNPELVIPVLDTLWIHFNSIYVMEEESIPPIKFSKITLTKDVDVKLQEPVGKLIYTIGLILTKVEKENEDNQTIIKFKRVLESLCKRMVNCELIHLELDDGTDLLDIIPESKHKILVLKEALSIYEGLIGYKISMWGPDTERNSQQISSLFQSYFRFLDFSKNLAKPKKVDKKKQNENESKDSSNLASKLTKDTKKNYFEVPKTILDFQTIVKILALLHKPEVNWTSSTEANIIKSKCEIHQHVMGATLQLIKKLKGFKIEELKSNKRYYDQIRTIAEILYNHCIVRLDSFIDFDSITATLAMECFYLILSVVSTHYKSNFLVFINDLAEKDTDEEPTIALQRLIETYQKLFELEEIQSSTDIETKKISLIIMNTVTLLSSNIAPTATAPMLDWLKNFININTLNNKQTVSSLVNLLFTVHIKSKSSTTIFETVVSRLCTVLGTIDEEENECDELVLINEATAVTVFPLVCNALKTYLDDIDWITSRLRSEFGMISYPGEDNSNSKREYLKSKEKGICCQLCSIITIFNTLCNVKVPPGPLSDALLKIVSHLYNSLSSLTKYFILRSSKVNLVFQGARFENVIKLAGKQLLTLVYDYILYIESINKQNSENTQSKKKSVNTDLLKNKVLRETRLIPKVIFEIEQFGKSVILLSKKTHVELYKYVGQGSARDFRIKDLKEVLAQATQHEDENSLDTTSEGNMEVDDPIQEEISDDSGVSPKRKRKS